MTKISYFRKYLHDNPTPYFFRMEYNFTEIEKKWQKYWEKHQTFKVTEDPAKPKYYVLDMFPYPSGAGLHVGHPLGYIASDIYSRYKRLKGYNVLHPMGFDAFGLPAEQYAIQTGQHPAITTENNIHRYREQMDKIGFCYDWSREVRTCDHNYYKWTQWVFIKLFKHWFNKKTKRAETIEDLISEFEKNGNSVIEAAQDNCPVFTASQWKSMSEKKQQLILLNYRLAYYADSMVNWCPALGTVLANDEVKDGFSVRGGHRVEQKKMKQWLLRVSAYAERLIDSLEKIEWSDSLKEIQKNWIGRSEGAVINFRVDNPRNNIKQQANIEVFTTRPDTIFGCTYMVLAPEHELVENITTPQYKNQVDNYLEETKKRTERERMADIKTITGQFTGAYASHPFSGEKLPVWISDYVLAGYGTGAIMAVPAHDSRDYDFAKHFDLPIKEVVSGGDISQGSYDNKEGILINSDFLNGLDVKNSITKTLTELEKKNIGYKKINYRLRDAIFSRQRYWGEPFPVYYKDEVPYVLEEDQLPLLLPEVDAYLPTEKGEPPLGRAKNWKTSEGYPLELSTMPGFAGSSAYYLRYMDPQNNYELVSKEANQYWENVDLYIGGTEHATGHLIYSRFWNKFLYDIGIVCKDEPFKKLINQGMIQGRSSLVFRVNPEKMAEYVLWEMIRDKKLGVEFIRNFRDGSRRFDFFSPETGIIIEIKKQRSLKKLTDPYKAYATKKGYNLLLIPILDFIDRIDEIRSRIEDAINGKNNQAFIEREPMEEFPVFVSKNFPGREFYSDPIHVDINLVNNDILDIGAFIKWQPHLEKAKFIFEEDGTYRCGSAVEKMSKSFYNVVNPDDIIEQYGADTLRLYEMFLGPLEQSKPWDTNGIDGVHKFLRKLWKLFHNENNEADISDDKPSPDELKILHKTIKKIQEDIERFSFNTSVSAFMICVNELTVHKCNKKEILRDLVIILSPFAPHISEELWQLIGNKQTISNSEFPEYKSEYLSEDTIQYPVSFNGKTRLKIDLPANYDTMEIEREIMKNDNVLKYLKGDIPRKVIVVKGRIINIVT